MRAALAALALLCAAAQPWVAAAAPTRGEVEEALTCQCGCGLTVHSCNHLQCGFAVPAREEIARLVSEGVAKEEILARFSAKYGEKVLSAPTASGFNLLAWTVPFVAVLAGAGIVGVVVVRWKRRGGGGEAAPSGAAGLEAYRGRLEDELEGLDR